MIEFKNKCYVLIQTNKAHPISKDRFSLKWYPERSMTLFQCVKYVPFITSIVTENPWLISCYHSKDVYILKNGIWEHPSEQTFGCSISIITSDILLIDQSIPSYPKKFFEACKVDSIQTMYEKSIPEF